MSTIEEPLRLSNITLPNRVIRSAVHSFLPATDGHLTAAELAMYEALATNHVGTIISGHVCVAVGGRANPEQANIYSDEYIEDFRAAAERIHAHGALFIPQISHAGPRAIDTEDLADVSARPLKKDREARALTLAEIKQIEQDFIAAARRLQAAGVDGVQLHAAHSYLLSRFIDPTFNERTDEYGGSAEGRFRIACNIITGIKQACGADFPVLMKINIDTKHDDAAAYHEAMIYMLERAQELGVELVELSGVDFINQPKDAHLYYLEEARRLRAAVPTLPLSLVGGVRTLAEMEEVLAAGIDAVSLGRPLVAEPDFVTKQLAGADKSICLSCNRCFVMPNVHPGIRCVWAWKAERARQKAAKQG